MTRAAAHRLEGPEYATLKHRLEDAHAAVEAALIEARRRVRMNEERDRDRSSEGEAVGLASPSVYPAPLYSLG